MRRRQVERQAADDAPWLRGHHQDAIGQAHGFHQVVGDHQHTHVAGGLLGQQQGIEFFLEADVQRGEGFVEQQQVRLQHQRPGQRNAALHAARQLVRKLAQVAMRQAQPERQGFGPPQSLAFADVAGLQAQGNVVEGGFPGQQVGLLEHAGGIGEAVLDLPVLHIQQAGAQVQQSGLAAAGRSDQGDHFTGVQAEFDVAEYLVAAEGMGQGVHL